MTDFKNLLENVSVTHSQHRSSTLEEAAEEKQVFRWFSSAARSRRVSLCVKDTDTNATSHRKPLQLGPKPQKKKETQLRSQTEELMETELIITDPLKAAAPTLNVKVNVFKYAATDS